jgi:DNA modification methylase
MIDINKNYNESNLETMAKMPDCFLDLVVTSPPYDGLRTYNGYSFYFESVAKELYRVTKEGGVIVWIVGDATMNGSESGTSFKQALFFKEIGFNLHDTMIYQRTGAFHSNMRYNQDFEYMFVFSKGKPNTFNALRQMKTANTLKRQKNKTGVGGQRKEDGTLEKFDENHRGFKRKERARKDETRLKSNIWNIARGNNCSTKDKIAFKHPAIFPEKLVNDHIISWSNENDLVYDPFMGSGTTAKMSILNNRNWIGSEISSEYCNIIEERIKKALEEKRKEKDLQAGNLFGGEM